MCLGKRLIFGVVYVICVTVVSCFLKLTGETVVKLFGYGAGLYIAGQTITDSIKKVKEANK